MTTLGPVQTGVRNSPPGSEPDAEVKTPADCFLESYFAGIRCRIPMITGIIAGGSVFMSMTLV